MERGSGSEKGGANDIAANDTSCPSHRSRNMSLEMIQDKRGPYLCISGVGKSLACLPAAEKNPRNAGLPQPFHPQIPGTTLCLMAGVSRGLQQFCSHLTLSKR